MNILLELRQSLYNHNIDLKYSVEFVHPYLYGRVGSYSVTVEIKENKIAVKAVVGLAHGHDSII